MQVRSGAESSQTARVLSGDGWWTDTGTDMSRGQSPDFSSGALPTTGLVDLNQSRLAGYGASSSLRMRSCCLGWESEANIQASTWDDGWSPRRGFEPSTSDYETDARRRPGWLQTDRACLRWLPRRSRRLPTATEGSSG